MPSLIDLAKRIRSGPKMAEMDWNMGLFNKLTELAQRYAIRLPDEFVWFNEDDDLADRAFAAALDLISELGIYCPSLERRLMLGRREILTAIEYAPCQIQIGQGDDSRILRKRAPASKERFNYCPGLHAPFETDLGAQVAAAHASDSRADFIEGFNFTEIDGHEVFGLPLEAWGTLRQVELLRRITREASRPGLAIVLYPISTRLGALLAALGDERGLRPGDGMLLSVLPDVKIEQEMLTAAIVGQRYGLFGVSASFGIVGGFCGGIEGAIIEGIAKPIIASLVYGVHVNVVGIESSHANRQATIDLPPIAWARSIVCQALARNTNTIPMALGFSSSGPGTDTNLREIAIRAIEAQVNGSNLYITRHSRAQMNAGQTPIESRWMYTVAEAARHAQLDRRGGGQLCQEVARPLMGRKPEAGFTVGECYDLVRGCPLPAYEEIRTKLEAELSHLDLPVCCDQALT